MITPTPIDTHAAAVSIAQKIESYLGAKRISRKALQDAAGLSHPTFNRSMAGGRSFTINEIIRIAAKLEVHTYDILPEEITQRSAA